MLSRVGAARLLLPPDHRGQRDDDEVGRERDLLARRASRPARGGRRRPDADPRRGRGDAALRRVDPGDGALPDPRRRAARRDDAGRNQGPAAPRFRRSRRSAAGPPPISSTFAATPRVTSRSVTGSTTASAPRSARLEARVALEELLPVLGDYVVEKERSRRVHSGNVRGFASLPLARCAERVCVRAPRQAARRGAARRDRLLRRRGRCRVDERVRCALTDERVEHEQQTERDCERQEDHERHQRVDDGPDGDTHEPDGNLAPAHRLLPKTPKYSPTSGGAYRVVQNKLASMSGELRNRRFWDADADAYQAVHGTPLRDVRARVGRVAHSRVGVAHPRRRRRCRRARARMWRRTVVGRARRVGSTTRRGRSVARTAHARAARGRPTRTSRHASRSCSRARPRCPSPTRRSTSCSATTAR